MRPQEEGEQKANRFTLFVHRRTIDAGGGLREFLEAHQGCGITYWSNFGQSRYATPVWTKRFELMTCKELSLHSVSPSFIMRFLWS